MIEKLHLCHSHIALSLFLLEEDLSPWVLGESWPLNAHSHIHSLCPRGNLSRTSPFASLPSSKTSHYLWSHFSEGSERLMTLRPAPPLCALCQSRDSLFKEGASRQLTYPPGLLQSRDLCSWELQAQIWCLFQANAALSSTAPPSAFLGLQGQHLQPLGGVLAPSAFIQTVPSPLTHSLLPKCSELLCRTILALWAGVAAYQAGGFGFYTGIGSRFWSKLLHFLARKPRQHMAQCSQFKSDT